MQGCGYALSLAAFGVYNAFALQDKARKAAKMAKEGNDEGSDDVDVDNGVTVSNRSDANISSKRSLVRGDASNQKMKRDFNDPMVHGRAGNSEHSRVPTSGGGGGKGVLGGGGRSSNQQKAKTSPLAAESPVPGGGGGGAVGKGLDSTHNTGGSLHARTGASCRSSGPLREE